MRGRGNCRGGGMASGQARGRMGKMGTTEAAHQRGSWSNRESNGIQGIEQISIHSTEDHGRLLLIIRDEPANVEREKAKKNIEV